MNEPSPTLTQTEGHWPGDVGFPVPWIHTKTFSLFARDHSTRQGTQWMSTQFPPPWKPGKGDSLFLLNDLICSLRSARELSLWAQHYSVSFPLSFLLFQILVSLTDWRSGGVKACDSPDPGSQTVRKEQRAMLHLRPSSPCLLPHYVLTWGKPALHPPFLAGPAVTRTKRQGHKLAHKASFCLDHGHTWYRKEKPSVAPQDKEQERTPVKQGKEKDQEQAYWTGEVSWMAER